MRERLQECQRTTTHYEWVVEEIDVYGDIFDCHAFDNLKDMKQWFSLCEQFDDELDHFDWGLHRMSGSEAEGLQDSQYAYVKNDKLPIHFDGGNIVPKKYHAQVERFYRSNAS